MQKKLKSLNFQVKSRVKRILRSGSSQNISCRASLDEWITQLRSVPEPKGRVLITALRNHTWIEWAAYTAAFIRQWGFESTLIFKGEEVSRLYPERKTKNFWEGVGRIPGIVLIDLNDLSYDQADYDLYFKFCEKPAIAALAYDLHLESADIVDDPEKYKSRLSHLMHACAKNGARIKAFLKKNKFHQFICYSGLISDTSCILQGAIDAGQEVVCVEGWAWRNGHMIYNFNSPSLEYNVEGWMRYFGAWDEKKNQEMSEYFKFLDGQEQNEDWLQNFYNVQQAKLTDEVPHNILDFVKDDRKIFLLACNVIGDSSLLNRETIFRSHCDFIKKTIDFFSTRQDLKLIIRAHPAEEWVKDKVAIKLGDFARIASKDQKNVLVINPDEKVNTFALLPYVCAGLVWITSAGVDMVVRGKPVIAAAKPKYSGLGIVEEPGSQSEFFRLIDQYARNPHRPTLVQIQKAKEYLYLVFKGFSFEAQGKNFRADTCRLNEMPAQDEHDRFYRILLGLETAPDRAL